MQRNMGIEITAILFLFLLSSCGIRLPEAARQAAFAEATCKNDAYECSDYTIDGVQKLEITLADEENGVTEKWCLRVTFISRLRNQQGEWRDEDAIVILRKVFNDYVVDRSTFMVCYFSD